VGSFFARHSCVTDTFVLAWLLSGGCLFGCLQMEALGYSDEVAVLQGDGFYRDATRYQFIQQTGSEPYMAMPPFRFFNGRLWSTYNAHHYLLCASKYPDTCSLSQQQRNAISVFETIAWDLMEQFILQPGDVLLLNNHTMLHARSEFQDGPEPHQRRHLIRLWLGCKGLATVAPPHLGFERSYGPDFDPASYTGLLKPNPHKFHVPLSIQDNGL